MKGEEGKGRETAMTWMEWFEVIDDQEGGNLTCFMANSVSKNLEEE